MAKLKYDVQNVEPTKEFDKPVPVGVYKCLVDSAVVKPAKSSGSKMLELVLEVASGEHKGRKLWEYIVWDENSDWKQRQLIDALGAKLKGTLDTDKLIGQTLTVKTKHEPWERENEEGETEIVVTSKVASLLKPKSADEDAEDEDEADEETPEAEEGEEPEEADEEEDDGEEPEAEADEDAEDELTWDDLAGYDRKELKEFIKENESEVKVKKSMSDDDIRKALAEEWEVEIPSDDEDEEDEDDEGTDYSTWSMPDLKKELKSRDLKVAGTKKALIKRLEKDDASGSKSGDEPF